jgi:uncharacterized protein YjbI with pentapeptide repeats
MVLQGAHLYGVNLDRATLHAVNLDGVSLGGANLQGARLYGGVNLRNAEGLTQEQLDSAVCSTDTEVPPGLIVNVKHRPDDVPSDSR